MSSASLPDEARAQALGVRPHIAPLSSSVPAQFSRPPGTPQLNFQDQQWNHGESFVLGDGDADFGGHLGYGTLGSHAVHVELRDVFDAGPLLAAHNLPSGWHPYTWVDPLTGNTQEMQRFVGYLRPGQLGPYVAGQRIADAAFELFAPLGDPPANRLIAVLGVWATTSKPALVTDPLLPPGGRFAYPGRRLDGLVPPGTGGDLSLTLEPYRAGGPEFVAKAPAGYTVIAGYIVTRVFGRPEVFALQRTRELRQAIERILAAPTSDPRHPSGMRVLPEESFACLVGGGSFGSLTSQTLVIRYPEEFHGAFANVFGSGPRRTLADQFNFTFAAQRTGFGVVGGAYYLEDTLEWGVAGRWLDPDPAGPGWGYHDLAPLTRRRLAQLQRPIAMYLPDEDTIGHGTDFLPILSGVRGHVASRNAPSDLSFVSVDRRCHDAGFYTTPIGGQPAYHPLDTMMEMVPHAWNAWSTNPAPALAPSLVDDGREDAYAWALDRVLMPAYQAQPSDVLQLETGFGNGGHTAGQGMALGFDETLKVANVTGLGTAIFAGSSDGTVSRWVLNPTSLELDLSGQSAPLGSSVSALAVGDCDQAHAGDELVVGTRNHLFVLDAVSLQVLRHTALGYEHTSPRRIQICEVFDGWEYTGREIAFTTTLGHLVVMSGDDFGTRGDLGEPGIEDFAVPFDGGGDYAGFAETDSEIPITLLSHRGHLANVTLGKGEDPLQQDARLHCWTEGQEGTPADLEYLKSPSGVPVVVAAYYTETRVGAAGLPDVLQLRAFDALTLQPASMGVHGMPTQLGRTEFSTSGGHRVLDIAPIHGSGVSGPLRGFVVLLSDRLVWVPIGANPPTGRAGGYLLDGFAPATRALAVTSADLRAYTGSAPGGEQFHEEIILSTLSGHVVWFHLEDMIDDATDAYLSLPNTNRPPAPGTTHTPYTNRTLAGTWGMLLHDEGNGQKLFAGDQAGSLWEIDLVTGAGKLRADMRHAYDLGPGNSPYLRYVAAPCRDLLHVGSLDVPAGGPIPNDPARHRFPSKPSSGPDLPAWWVQTEPWQDAANNVLAPHWVKETQPEPFNKAPTLPVADGFVPLLWGGAALDHGAPVNGASRQLHWWGGDQECYTNLIQGLFLNQTTALENWFSTKDFPVAMPPNPNWYGPTSNDCKDLRNTVRYTGDAASYHMQSLRVTTDATGPIIVASTPGGSVVVLAAGQIGANDYGTILWDSSSPVNGALLDDGEGAMGLAVRSVEGVVDIFVGIATSHLDPAPFNTQNPASAGKLVGGVRWLRWTRNQGSAGTMTTMGAFLHLDPKPGAPDHNRGGFGVCGLAVGDLIAGLGEEELIVTTLDGDLFVYSVPRAGGDLSQANPIHRSWVPGALGVCNSILIAEDGQGTGKKLYVAGSQGIWKWGVNFD